MKTLLLKLYAAVLTATPAVATTVHAAELHAVSSGDFAAAHRVPGPKFAAQTGNSLNTALGPSIGKSPEVIPDRSARGEPADVVIMVGYALNDLIKQGKAIPESRVELADSRIGMVVCEGAAKSDISSSEAPKHMLLHAKSIVYLNGASGVYTERKLLKGLGIEEQVKAKAKMIPRIPMASVVAIGDYEVGSQQVSKLLSASSATSIGKIPESPWSVMHYAAGILVGARHPKEAKALLDYLASPAVQADVKSIGLDSMPSQ